MTQATHTTKGSSVRLTGLLGLLLPICMHAPAALVDYDSTAGLQISSEVRTYVNSGTDYWGEKAMALPEGPTFEFFRNAVPPFRWCDAEFLHYPIVLSAPGAARKSRMISNGSGINARANNPRWKEVGTPVRFFVGDDTTTFGADLAQVHGPHYRRGYLPIVEVDFLNAGTTYSQEVFTAADDRLSSYAVTFVRFTTAGGSGKLVAEIDTTSPVYWEGTAAYDTRDRLILLAGSEWKRPGDRADLVGGRLSADVASGTPATLAVFTKPVPRDEAAALLGASTSAAASRLARLYDNQRENCVRVWETLIAQGTQITVPEKVVNDCWRAHIIGNYMLLIGDQQNYSHGNQYERNYVGEGGDAIRALMLGGYIDDMPRMIVPILNYRRAGLFYHQAAFKLQAISHYYWITRDADYLREQRPRWQREVDKIINDRETSTGLLPRERYAGDISTHVVSLNSNANSWRGLHDIAAVLRDMGEASTADAILKQADEFRERIVKAVEMSERTDVDPPFIPMALFGEEEPPERITQTRWGAYYDLMIPYVIGSEVFGQGDKRENWILDTLHRRGGIFMGMMRSHPGTQQYIVPQGHVNLYSLRYALALLRRDEVDRALVGFYGKLAQGQTWDTFISGESAGLVPLNEWGRPTYMPPNSAANAYFMQMLRYLLIQDWDLDGNGEPETLRLLYATPRAWLEDGKVLNVERAPTAFGTMSMRVQSEIAKGRVSIELDPPTRNPHRTLLKLRLPDGYRVTAGEMGEQRLKVKANGIVELPKIKEPQTLVFDVEQE